MDILGPLPETENGNVYICVVSDYFTKWAEAYAMPDHTAQTIAERLMHDLILKYGTPRVIHTDQGRDFESKLMRQLCDLMEIKKSRTCTYRPQSDAIVERLNRTLIQMLSSFVNEHQDNWDDILPYVMSAYRATVHESTNCSPDLMFLGHEKMMPIDLIVGGPPKDQVPQCPNAYVEWVREATTIAHEFARKHLQKAAERQKRNYDAAAKYRKFPIGTWVWYYYPPKAQQKLGRGWTGPYLVVETITDVNFRIQEKPGGRTRIVHMDQIKLFEGDPPRESWVEVPKPQKGTVEKEPGMADGIRQDEPKLPGDKASEESTPEETDESEAEEEVAGEVPCAEETSGGQEEASTTPSKMPAEDISRENTQSEPDEAEAEERTLRRGTRIRKPPERMDL